MRGPMHGPQCVDQWAWGGEGGSTFDFISFEFSGVGRGFGRWTGKVAGSDYAGTLETMDEGR